jgi:transcriptional regulator with XRE-family HTH domain
MAQGNDIQSVFFERIRKVLPATVSLADELAEVLNISRDSAYRRMRGETVLSLDEVKKLALRFRISVDSILSPESDEIALFQYQSVDSERFTFSAWLKTISGNLSLLQKFPDPELWYFAKDIPVFYYFNSPLLSCFKMYFWMSAVLRYDGYRNGKFNPSIIPREMTAIGHKIFEQYTSINRTEIWSEETLNVTLRQIEFFYDCGFFEDPSFATQLCDEYSVLVKNICTWAEAGFKDRKESGFTLYKNDLLIADNTILFKMGDRRMVFIPYNTLNILSTTNELFCLQTDDYLKNLISKSDKISTTGAKQRNAFFNQMNDKIRVMRKKFA